MILFFFKRFKFLFFLPFYSICLCQQIENIEIRKLAHNFDGEYYIWLPTIVIESDFTPNGKKKSEWSKLKYNVRKVYPFAVLASKRLREYETVLDSLPTEKQKRDYTKIVEKKLKQEFSEDLKRLSLTQGRILIKLIDRQTGNTSYNLVKQLRGGFSAMMWQSMALVFGSNLKSNYDPLEEDRHIEIIVQQIENE